MCILIKSKKIDNKISSHVYDIYDTNYHMMKSKITCAQFLLFLRKCFELLTGEYYPHELINFIIILSQNDIRINCADTRAYLMKNDKYMYWMGDESDDTHDTILHLGIKFVYYSGSDSHFIGLTVDGDMYFWCHHPHSKMTNPYPKKILSNIKNAALTSQGKSMFAVDKQDKIYAWGGGTFGQLGLGHYDNVILPQELKLLCGVHMIKGTNFSTIFNLKNGEIYTCGCNYWGQLGLGDNTKRSVPHKVNLDGIVAIDCGSGHVVSLSKLGEIFSWGCNFHGELGLGNTNHINNPHKVMLGDVGDIMYSRDIVSISCGNNFTLALTKFGDIYSCGDNLFGQLGLGSSHKYGYILYPQKIDINSKIISINTGAFYTFAVDVYGEIYFWGQCGYKKYVYKPKVFTFC